MATATTRETELHVRAFAFSNVRVGDDDDDDDDDDDESVQPCINLRILVEQTYYSSDGAFKSFTRNGETSSQYPYHSITYDLLSTIIAQMNIPFPLEKLHWEGDCDCKLQEAVLENVDALISCVLDEARFMVDRSGGEKKNMFALHLFIDNRVILSRHEIEAREKEDRVLGIYRFISSMIKLECKFLKIASEIRNLVRDTAPIDKDNKYERDLELSLLGRAMTDFFQALETLKFEGDKEEQLLCAICKDDIFIGSRVARMPCSHIYHVRCIAEWLKRSLICPMCRCKLSTAYPKDL